MDRNKSKHHIVPKSRLSRIKDKRNIAIVMKTTHDRYHTLFGNRLPDEIIKYLVENFWNGQWHWVNKAMAKYIK